VTVQEHSKLIERAVTVQEYYSFSQIMLIFVRALFPYFKDRCLCDTSYL